MCYADMKKTTVALGILILSIFVYCFSIHAIDPDLWGHLRYGQDIIMTHSVPRFDYFSYSSYGATWINHEWLSEVILYLIFKVSKGTGLILFKYFMGFTIMSLIYISNKKYTKSIYLRLTFIALALTIITSGFAIRPQIFTYVFFTCLIFLLDNYENTSDTKWLYALPFILFFWVNLHGGFIAGVGLLGAYVLYKYFKREVTKPFIFIVAVSFIVTLANPYGIRIWEFVINAVLKQRPYITEWSRIKFSLEYFNYFALFIITCIGVIFSKHKRSLFETFVIIVAFYFSFQHNRHIVLFAIVASIYVPKYIESLIGKKILNFESKFSNKFISSVLVYLSVLFFLLSILRGRNFFQIEIPEDRYPMNAVNFLQQNKIFGNILSSFNWAQMCIWEFYPKSKVFFDGRFETVYSDELIREYPRAMLCQKDYKSFLKEFPETDIIFIDSYLPLASALSKDNEWVNIYSSKIAKIFLHNNAHNRNTIVKFVNKKLIFPCPKNKSSYF
jgi:hypothetical protein